MLSKHSLKWIIIAALVFTALLVLGMFTQSWLENRVIEKHPIASVTGQIVSPFVENGVSGLDLTVNEVTIRTSESGSFNFPELNGQEYIQINQPELKRTILARIESNSVAVYYDTELFNTLIAIVDLEARGQKEKIFAYLPESLSSKQSVSMFTEKYENIFGQDDITDQELTVESTEIERSWFSPTTGRQMGDVVALTLKNNSWKKAYYFINDQGKWYLVN